MKYYNPNTGESTDRVRIPNVLNAKYDTIIANGWKEFVDIEPEYDPTTEYIQRTNVVVVGTVATQNYVVLVKPIEVPQEITATQGIAYLIQLELLDEVEQAVQLQNDPILNSFWNRAATWSRTSQVINNFALMFSIDLDSFFIEASKIKI